MAGEYPLDQKTVVAIGRALGQRLATRDQAARVVIGQDTRESGAWIADRLALLDHGDVVIEGTFEELQKSDIEFVREFLKHS